jgi:hypothetical protein
MHLLVGCRVLGVGLGVGVCVLLVSCGLGGLVACGSFRRFAWLFGGVWHFKPKVTVGVSRKAHQHRILPTPGDVKVK